MLLIVSGLSRDASVELGSAGEEDLEVVPFSGMRFASKLLDSVEVKEEDAGALTVSALAVSAPLPFCSCLPYEARVSKPSAPLLFSLLCSEPSESEAGAVERREKVPV